MSFSTEHITIETIILVAVWDNPVIFQGGFCITNNDISNSIWLLFRCEYQNLHQQDTVDDEFNPNAYYFSHLYNATGLIHLDPCQESTSYAEYVLKHALYKTLLEMRTSQKQRLSSFDKTAMNAMINQVKPLLRLDGIWEDLDQDIGFAAEIDFSPQEKMGKLAMKTLLKLGQHNRNH